MPDTFRFETTRSGCRPATISQGAQVDRKYWIKVAVSMVLIFVVGAVVVHGVRAGIARGKVMLSSVMPAGLPWCTPASASTATTSATSPDCSSCVPRPVGSIPP